MQLGAARCAEGHARTRGRRAQVSASSAVSDAAAATIRMTEAGAAPPPPPGVGALRGASRPHVRAHVTTLEAIARAAGDRAAGDSAAAQLMVSRVLTEKRALEIELERMTAERNVFRDVRADAHAPARAALC